MSKFLKLIGNTLVNVKNINYFYILSDYQKESHILKLKMANKEEITLVQYKYPLQAVEHMQKIEKEINRMNW